MFKSVRRDGEDTASVFEELMIQCAVCPKRRMFRRYLEGIVGQLNLEVKGKSPEIQDPFVEYEGYIRVTWQRMMEGEMRPMAGNDKRL